MAVKKSRTGKKKRPIYGPQGTGDPNSKEKQEQLRQDYITYTRARYANYAAIGLLLLAMAILFIAPGRAGENSNLYISIAYGITIVSGCLILYTAKYVNDNRVRMTRITGWVMVGVGAFGLILNMLAFTGFVQA